MPAPPTLPALQKHLEAILQDPATTDLDMNLVETFTAGLTEAASPELIPLLVPSLTSILPLLTAPSAFPPVTALLLRLLDHLTFPELLYITTADDLTTALLSPAPPISHLALSLLSKTTSPTAAPSEAGILASHPELLRAIIGQALAAEDTGVAEKAGDLLVGVLRQDALSPGGAHLVWRRAFAEEGVYKLFWELCAREDVGGAAIGDENTSRRRKSEAQSRLLALLPRLADIDFDAIVKSRFPSVESTFTENACGLLPWAIRDMVDTKGDLLLHLVVLDFYSALLRVVSGRGLEILKQTGKHAEVTHRFLNPELEESLLDREFLTSKAAEYLCAYAEVFPGEFFSERLPGTEKLSSKLAGRVALNLKEAQPQAPDTPSLSLLPYLPVADIKASSAMPNLQLSPPSVEILSTLTKLFSRADTQELWRIFTTASNKPVWTTLCAYAETPALQNVALTSLELMDAVTGHEWGLAECTQGESTMVWMAAAPERFEASRGGGDADSWAWKVARRRWELVRDVVERMKGGVWKSVLEGRVKEGVWGVREGMEVATGGAD